MEDKEKRGNLVRQLYEALIHDRPFLYEELRRDLIWEYGYGTFFDIQSEAFTLISKGDKP